MKRLLREEDGSIMPLIVFFSALALILVLGVVGATSLHLARERLLTLADGAALAGAEAFELADVTVSDGGFDAHLSSAGVRSAASAYLASIPHGSLEDLRLESATSNDGLSAAVSLSAWWRPPVLTVLLPDGIRLDVESTARSVFR